MARLSHASEIYAAARTWMNVVLVGDGSVFLPEQHLWTVENIRALRDAFTGNPLPGAEKFEEKFKQQLTGWAPEVIQLASEMLWVLFLFPRGKILPQRKRELIKMVWGWSGAVLDPAHPMLLDTVMAGIGDAGTAFNKQRDRELEGLIDLTLTLKERASDFASMDPWEAGELIDGVAKAARRNIRNIMLHLLFPDQYERIASVTHKRDVAAGFSTLLPPGELPSKSQGVQLDRQLREIRRRLEEQSPGKQIDFYDPELRAIWNPPLDANAEARAGVTLADQLARAAGLAEPTPDLLLAAYLLLADDMTYASPAAIAVRLRMRSMAPQDGLKPSPTDLLLGRREIVPEPMPARLPTIIPSPAVVSTLDAASKIREMVAEGRPQLVSPRHILAVLLLPGHHSAAPVLQELGFDSAELRKALLESIEDRPLGENHAEWRRLLLKAETSAAPDLPVYAGFSTDALRTDEADAITRKDDRLDVMRDVAALSEVLAARETKPPLAVGLFGDWGTGKSFFMELMRQEIELLGTQNDSFYCGRVVQVWFNAWHYMESNLWASLAARVFEELAWHLENKWKLPAQQTKQLFDQLQASQGVLAEAVSERNEADARLKHIQAELEQGEQTLAGAARIAFGAAAAALRDDEALRGRMEEVTRELGISDARDAVERTAAEGREILSLGRRVIAFARALRRQPVFLASGIAMFAAITWGVAWAIHRQWDWGLVPRVLTALVAGLAAARAVITPVVRQVNQTIGWLESVAANLRDRAEAQGKEKALAAQRELTRLEQREREARARVEALNREVEDLRSGRRLQRFILERHTSAEYRQHLGLVNLIRNDFELLSKLLSETQKESTDGGQPAAHVSEIRAGDAVATAPKTQLPRIDRIILYIDDLDRCPEERVVQVLQAVHLLLAFPLFVVVVGVDSRWLLLSLEDHYAALRGRPADGRENGSHDAKKSEAEWSTTPHNYLEKIFQIPFTLSPMKPSGFGSLVEALLPLSAAGQTPNPPAAGTDGDKQSPGAETQKKEPSRTASRAAEHIEPEPNPDAGDDDDEMNDREDDEESSHDKVGQDGSPVPPRSNPQGLTVEKRERDLIVKLYPLIASPRALKRFTNLYRLLRVQQRGAALDRFRGADGRPGEFEAVALLLAAVVGYPIEAARLLHAVLTQRDRAWWTLVEELDETGAEEDAATRGALAADRASLAAERGRATLREALLKVRSASPVGDHPPATFVRWAREVARFSFQSGRILSLRAADDGASGQTENVA